MNSAITPPAYTDAVGYKFNKDGSCKSFPGATIISFIREGEEVYSELSLIAKEAQATRYAHKYTFLPPSSYHMTNFVVFNDNEQDRNSEGWSSKFPRDTSCEQMIKNMYEAIQHIDHPKGYTMRVRKVGHTGLRLLPADDDTANSLRNYREALAEATGIYWEDHNDYEFHATYAYLLIELDEQEQQEREKLLAKQTERLQKNLSEFYIRAPEYCTIRDMSQFDPYGGM